MTLNNYNSKKIIITLKWILVVIMNMEIFLYYIKHYIWCNTVVVHKFSCDSLLSILTKWNVHRRKKKFDNNLTEPLPMSLRIFEDACFKKWISMPTNIYKTTAIKISYLLTSQEDRRRRPSIFPCSRKV